MTNQKAQNKNTQFVITANLYLKGQQFVAIYP